MCFVYKGRRSLGLRLDGDRARYSRAAREAEIRRLAAQRVKLVLGRGVDVVCPVKHLDGASSADSCTAAVTQQLGSKRIHV